MNSSQKKPAPLQVMPRPKICTVCGKSSYSLAGIHPQCAVRAADKARMEKACVTRLAKPPQKAPASLARYQKLCPRCRKVQHVRRKTCECGHVFSSVATK